MTDKSRNPTGDRLLHRCRSPALRTTSFTAAVNNAMTSNVLGFRTMDGDGPRFGAMIGLVAVVVATVILVFFGIGYALGRLFL
jgi:hypothetical protein